MSDDISFPTDDCPLPSVADLDSSEHHLQQVLDKVRNYLCVCVCMYVYLVELCMFLYVCVVVVVVG